MSPERLAAKRARDQARTRRWREQRTAAGRCHSCPKQTEHAAYSCRACARARAAAYAERMRRRSRPALIRAA